MISVSSQNPTQISSMFESLYRQLNKDKYPKTSDALRNRNNRLEEYLKQILENKVDEKTFFEITQLNKLISLINSSKVNISDKQLSQLVGGRAYRFDEKHDDSARNLFFEADFALRFVKSKENFKTINLNYEEIEDECDIVIDEKIIVECKNVSSKKQIYERIKQANKQLTTRLQHLATDAAGLIALDITQIIQPEFKIFITEELLPDLQKNSLINRLNHNASDPEVINVITKKCQNFLEEQLEKLNITVDKLDGLQISQEIYSIMFQSEMAIIIDKENKDDNIIEPIPIFGRNMIPFKNPLYKGKIRFSPDFHKSLQHSF